MYAETRPPSEQVQLPPAVRRLHTPAGLKYGSYAMMLSIVSSIITFIALFPLLRSIDFESITSENFFQVLGGLLALLCILGILGLVVVIFYILLLYEMYVGRNEFGEKHATRVPAALILIILGVIFSIVVPGMAGFGAGYTSGTEAEYTTDAAEFRNQVAISSGFGLVGTAAITLGLVFFPLELIAREKRYLLWLAFTLTILASVMGFLMTIILLPSEGTLELQDVLTRSTYSSIFSAFSIFGTVVMFLAYRVTRARILEGEILPVRVPVAQPPPPSAPPPGWG
ncbi:MAG: hypothetical protein ACE5QW_05545 [Thermoplasmata archaeon]